MTPAQRREGVALRLAELGLDALLVSRRENVRYLSGFSGEGLMVVAERGAAVSTDGRYELDVAQQCPDCAPILHVDGHLGGAIEQLRQWGCQRVGFEGDVLPYAQYERVRGQFAGVGLQSTQALVEELRLIKDEGEVALIREAAEIVDRALTALLADLQPGLTEREIALDLERAILLGGAEGIAFDTIVAAGPSAAYPHAVPGERVLERGMMLKIDVGARLGGYCSDITRTGFCGEPDERFRLISNLVYDAQAAALAAVGPGLECREADRIAREVIVEGGYGAQFTHGLGHGVGLEVHERPRVSARSEEALAPGMVVTIEPGIYIEGWGGVRTEDLVLITETGAEVLTSTPKQRYG
jgi:Xaa-Pro aminopeptidase